jgi:hypothetical protein
MQGVGGPVSDSQTHLHSHHSLVSAAENGCQCDVSNVVEMIGTVTGLSVQTATMKVKWCVSLINVLPTSCNRFPSRSTFRQHRSARQGRCPAHLRGVHIFPWCAMARLTLRRSRGVYLPSLQHPRRGLAVQKPPAGSTEHVRAPDPPYATRNRASPRISNFTMHVIGEC